MRFLCNLHPGLLELKQFLTIITPFVQIVTSFVRITTTLNEHNAYLLYPLIIVLSCQHGCYGRVAFVLDVLEFHALLDDGPQTPARYDPGWCQYHGD